jgi:copper chaperone CopZ
MLLATLGFITPMLAIVVMIISIFAILINTLRIRTLRLETVNQETTMALTEASFKVTNMVCEGCAEKITTALTALPGVKDVKPKVISKHVQVNYYPDKVKHEELKKVIEKEGFNAVEV